MFYEIFVRSFFDSNGDGIGDFNGITLKLDYLKELGINAIWLMPIFPSPSYHGYDVINYFDVNPQYGTLDDFKNLLAQAHQRGMHVIIDLVLNHTSNQNPWFESSNDSLQSPYRDWYIWSETDPGYLGPLGAAWFSGMLGFYYGIFGETMPDLNYKNEAVTAEMNKVADFWLQTVGVDGFRLDAINYLIEEGQKQVNTQSTHEWLKGFHTTYKEDKADAFTVGEVYGADAALARTYTGDQLDECFEFELASGFVNSAAGGTTSGVYSALSFMLQDLPDGQFATFLTNHDQDRVMSTLNGNVGRAKLAATLLFTAPGTPFIYYGEEIGMQGTKPDEQIRSPMQWSADLNGGFSTGLPWESLSPDWQANNVALETGDQSSLLSYYRTLIHIRMEHDALRGGEVNMVATQSSGLYSILRVSQDEAVLVLVNLTSAPISEYSLILDRSTLVPGKYSLMPILGLGPFIDLTISTAGGFSGYVPIPEIPAYGTLILQLQMK